MIPSYIEIFAKLSHMGPLEDKGLMHAPSFRLIYGRQKVVFFEMCLIKILICTFGATGFHSEQNKFKARMSFLSIMFCNNFNCYFDDRKM